MEGERLQRDREQERLRMAVAIQQQADASGLFPPHLSPYTLHTRRLKLHARMTTLSFSRHLEKP